jgi:hypothetical protein
MMLMMIQIESVQSRMAFDYFTWYTWSDGGGGGVSEYPCGCATPLEFPRKGCFLRRPTRDTMIIHYVIEK